MRTPALIVACLLAAPALPAAPAFTDAQALELVKVVDDRQQNSGDYRATCFVKDTERGKEPRIYQVDVYRRDQEDKFMMLFLKPRDEAGKGYLKIDKNLWMYDPATGKWERRTEREKIAGTNSRRADFDESRLAKDFTSTAVGVEALGDYQAKVVELTVKDGVDVAYPKIRLWIDAATGNVLKRQEFSLSGRLMRTAYYPAWSKKFSASKGADVWVPQEMRIFDDLEKGNSTVILVKETDLADLSDSLFTKAWIEGKSR